MLSSDKVSSYSAENEENNNEGGSESFVINIFTNKAYIRTFSSQNMENKIHLCVSCVVTRKTKQVQKQSHKKKVFLRKRCSKKNHKFIEKHTCLFFNKVTGCKILPVSFSVDFSVNFVFPFQRTVLGNYFR